MKIGIIGAPGSGKTELAKALAPKLEGETRIIDDYVEPIAKECDLAMGPVASYIGNLYVVLGRYSRERQADLDGVNGITCGTLIESTVYATLEAMSQQNATTGEASWVRITNFMNLVGSFYQDTFRYNPLFLVNLPGPGEGEDEEEFYQERSKTIPGQIDQHLFMSLNAFGYPYTKLEGTFEEKVKTAVEEIDKVRSQDEIATALR